MVVEFLSDVNPEVRVIATTFSGMIEDIGTIEQIRNLAVNDIDYKVRKKAVAALQERKDIESAELIREIAFKDPLPDVQQIAASAYATMKGEKAIPFLLDLLKEQKDKERTVERFKSAVKGVFIEQVLESRYKFFTLKLSIVRIMGSIEGEAANQALNDIEKNNGDREVREFAKIELLLRKGGTDAIQLLEQFIENKDNQEVLSGSLTFFVAPKARLVNIRAKEILAELQEKQKLN